MTKAQRELLGWDDSGTSKLYEQRNSGSGHNNDNSNISREQILQTILNDDELISHLKKMDFFVTTDNSNHSSHSDSNQKQQHSNPTRHLLHDQKLEQPVQSPYVKTERKDLMNNGRVHMDSVDNNRYEISNNARGHSSPITLRMQQGVPELSSLKDGHSRSVSSRGPAGAGANRISGYGFNPVYNRNRRGR